MYTQASVKNMYSTEWEFCVDADGTYLRSVDSIIT